MNIIKEFIVKYIIICITLGIVHYLFYMGIMGDPNNYLLLPYMKYFYPVMFVSMLVGLWLKQISTK